MSGRFGRKPGTREGKIQLRKAFKMPKATPRALNAEIKRCAIEKAKADRLIRETKEAEMLKVSDKVEGA